jgi:hypothetical protein
MHPYSLPYLQHERALAPLYQEKQNTAALCRGLQVAQVANKGAIDGRNDIAGLQAALRCGAAFLDVGNFNTAVAGGAGTREARPRQAGVDILARKQLIFELTECG